MFITVRDSFFIWYHGKGSKSLPRRIYQAYLRSRFSVRYHFGIKIAPGTKPRWYYNISTISLRNAVERKIEKLHEPDLLEIGVGAWVVLSGYFSRLVKRSIDACDYDHDFLETAKDQVEYNNLSVNLFYSDICSGIPEGKFYDLIFWNPDYHCGNRKYLPQLLEEAPKCLKKDGSVMIVYKTCTDREEVLAILSEYPAWKEVNATRQWWSPFEVMEIARV